MPRWRRVAGMLSMPPVAHPRRAAKPPAVTTVGAGLVPAHSHPKIGLHPSARAARKTPQICDILSVTEWAVNCGPDSGSETEILGTCPSNLAGKDVSAAATDTFISENIMRRSRVASCQRTTLNPSKSTTKSSRFLADSPGRNIFKPRDIGRLGATYVDMTRHL